MELSHKETLYVYYYSVVKVCFSLIASFMVFFDTSQDGHLKMLGGYLEFFMEPALAQMFQHIKRELDELIQNKVSDGPFL